MATALEVQRDDAEIKEYMSKLGEYVDKLPEDKKMILTLSACDLLPRQIADEIGEELTSQQLNELYGEVRAAGLHAKDVHALLVKPVQSGQ